MAELEDYIQELIAKAPPLSQEQSDRLARLLEPVATALTGEIPA